MNTHLLLTIYCICIVCVSLAGGFLPWMVKLTHRRMQFVMSLVGGFMLGVSLLHLLPHAVSELGSLEGHAVDRAVMCTLIGLLVMFLLIRVFHVHAHEHGDPGQPDCDDDHAHASALLHSHELPQLKPAEAGHVHSHACSHKHDHTSTGETISGHSFSWVGLAFGLALHTIIDGLALGAAIAAEAEESQFGLYAVGTFLAIALHKPLDSLSITSLMRTGGWSRQATVTANLAFACMCPLGAIGFVFGLDAFAADQHLIVGSALAFAAGVFLCISLADLLPEVTFHSHDRFGFTLALFLGVFAAWGIGFLEPKHNHAHPPTNNQGEHSHAGRSPKAYQQSVFEV